MLLDALPAATFVIDGVGNITWGSTQAAALVGDARDDFRGRSVLEFVTPDTAWAYASAVALASDYPDVVMGPLRIGYLDGAGERRDADMWASNHLDTPGINGIVCLITGETAASGMADAVSAVAAGQDPATVAELACLALRGAPVMAQTSVLAVVGDDVCTIAHTPDAPALDGAVSHEPWRPAVTEGIRQLFGQLTDAPAPLRDLGDGRFDAVWVEPVLGPDGPPAKALLVLWRTRPGNPSPNQLTSIHEAAAILALAFRDR